jgi:hypothetical protein
VVERIPGSVRCVARGAAASPSWRWYDRDFIRDWSNGALLVRDDTGGFLTAADLDAATT